MKNNPPVDSDLSETRLTGRSFNEKIKELLDEVYCVGYDTGSINGDDDNTELLEDTCQSIIDLICEDVIGIIQEDKPEYICYYEYDFVQDGNLDDLSSYCFDKGINYGEYSKQTGQINIVRGK